MIVLPMARYQDDDRDHLQTGTAHHFNAAPSQTYAPMHPQQSPGYLYSPSFYNNNSSQHSSPVHERYSASFSQHRQPPPPPNLHLYGTEPVQNFSDISHTPTLSAPSINHYQQSPVDQPYPSPASAFLHQEQWPATGISCDLPTTSSSVDTHHQQWSSHVHNNYWSGPPLDSIGPVQASPPSLPSNHNPSEVQSHASWDVPLRQHELPALIATRDDTWARPEHFTNENLITPPGSAAVVPKIESPNLGGSSSLQMYPAPVNASGSCVGPVRSMKRDGAPRSKRASTGGPCLWKGRTGPLSQTTREKSVSLREYGACWRCKKYRKPVCAPVPCP